MMDGITVLNKIDIMKTPNLFIFVAILGVVFLFILTFIAANTNNSSLVCIDVFLLFCLFIFVLCLAGGVFDKYSYTKYEVTIDNSVKITEFLDTYEVVEQRGDIWVIKDKKVENEQIRN